MEETKDELTEYLGVPKVERVNGCVISEMHYKNADFKKLLEEHPELKERYAYLEGTRALIDKKLASRIDKPTSIMSLRAKDVKALAESGVLDNPNIEFEIRLYDMPPNNVQKKDIDMFPKALKALENHASAMKAVRIYHQGLGVVEDLSSWSDQQLEALLSRVDFIDFSLMLPKELSERIRNIVHNNPTLNKEFMISSGGHTFINVEKSTSYRLVEEEMCFEFNDTEPKEAHWRKLAKFVKNNRDCRVGEIVSSFKEVPKEFLDELSGDDYKLSFYLEREGSNHSHLYTINDAIGIKSVLKKIESIKENGLKEEELIEFFSKFSTFEFDLIEDNDLRNQLMDACKTIPELKSKYIFISHLNQAINVDKPSHKKRFYRFDLGEEEKDELYWEKLERLYDNNEEGSILIRADQIKDIPASFLEHVSQKHPKARIQVSKTNDAKQFENYDVDELFAIHQKLEELVAGIDPNASEMERFVEVYKRVCNLLIYDYPAAYPKTPEEEEYSQKNRWTCRNLRNGLLEGKCVCAGYADILRNALGMVGIEAEYVTGEIVDPPISRKNYEKHKDTKYKFKHIHRELESEGIVTLAETHAWNKVKIDGRWYNCDPTWDASRISDEELPKYCLLSDEKISDSGKNRQDITGPECKDEIPANEIKGAFDKTHYYIGNAKIPKISTLMSRLFQKIKNLKNMKQTLELRYGTTEPLVYEELEPKEEKEEYPSWDLRNYDVDKEKPAQRPTPSRRNERVDEGREDVR